MRLYTGIPGWVALLMFVQVAWGDPELVGDRGDPDRILFVGNETFHSRQLRSALGFDLAVLLAAHPDASLNQLTRQLERRIEDGYCHSGFADAKVMARFVADRDAIVVTISEGTRSRCGDIQVTGAQTVPLDRLRVLLSSSRPKEALSSTGTSKSEESLWRVGEPASFAASHWKSQHANIQALFQSLGYHDVTFDAGVRSEGDGNATLVLAVQDEGPRAVLGEIEIVGNQKNSAEDVVRFLDLPPGVVLDSDLKARVEKQLSDSARFITHDVTIITPPFGNEASTLRIKLLEYADAPPLADELTAVEAAMVQLTRWLNSFETTDDDFEFRMAASQNGKLEPGQEPLEGAPSAHAHLVISHREQRCLLHAMFRGDLEQELFEFWIHLTPDQISLYSPPHRLRYDSPTLDQTVVGTIQWTAQPPDSEGRMSNVTFGLGVKSRSSPDKPSFLLQLAAAPVAALREAHLHRDSLKLNDGNLMIHSSKTRFSIDALTGRMKEFELRNGTQSWLTIACQPGLYRKLRAEYDAKIRDAKLVDSRQAPISSLLSFLATTVVPVPNAANGSESAVTTLVHSLLKRGAFSAFDQLLIDMFDSPEDEFAFPPEIDPKKAIPPLAWTAFILPVARQLFPPSSWAVTISREFVFLQTRRSPHSEQVIRGLLVDAGAGPLANLSAAYVLGSLNPSLKSAFAQRGLSRLKREHFQFDYEPLLSDNLPIGKFLTAAVRTLQDLDNGEIETLVASLPLSELDRRSLARILQLIPDRKSSRPIDTLREVLDEGWEPLIEPRVRALLLSLVN